MPDTRNEIDALERTPSGPMSVLYRLSDIPEDEKRREGYFLLAGVPPAHLTFAETVYQRLLRSRKYGPDNVYGDQATDFLTDIITMSEIMNSYTAMRIDNAFMFIRFFQTNARWVSVVLVLYLILFFVVFIKFLYPWPSVSCLRTISRTRWSGCTAYGLQSSSCQPRSWPLLSCSESQQVRPITRSRTA